MKRTITLSLDEDLLREARAVAGRRGITLTCLVEQSLPDGFDNEDRRRPRRRVELPTFGHGGTRPGVDISDSKSLWDLLDEEVGHLDKLR